MKKALITVSAIILAFISSVSVILAYALTDWFKPEVEDYSAKSDSVSLNVVRKDTYYDGGDVSKGLNELASYRLNVLSDLGLLEESNYREKTSDSDYVVQVFSKDLVGTGVYFYKNYIITAAHTIADESDISVGGYPATLVEIDRELDYAIINTILNCDNPIDVSSSDMYKDITFAKPGDSGMPVYGADDNLYGILIGKHKGGKYIVQDVRKILTKFFLSASFNNDER